MQNSFCKASKDNWNQTLRKAKILYQSFAKQRIRTLYAGSYTDEVTDINESWEKGVEMTMQEIVTLKLYTDFDKLQYELKKCFRWETIRGILLQSVDDEEKEDVTVDDEEEESKRRAELEQRLREFFHWRSSLLIMLNKFGRKISEDNMVLYHGVNAKMILNPGLCVSVHVLT